MAEEDAESPDEHVPEPEPAPKRSFRLGASLVGLAGGAWALVALIRCTGPTPGPAMTVPEPEPPAATPQSEKPEADPGSVRSETEPEPEPTVGAAEEPERLGDASLDPKPPAAAWAQNLKPPQEVTYKVRRGGSLENVANLFKVFHHEAQTLNPSVELKTNLAPNTVVVVYRREEGALSESVGFPSKGSLEGAVPMLDGPGRQLMAIPWKAWGTADTVIVLDAVLRQWAKRGKDVQPVLVGNLSSRNGGRLAPHSTHQSGRDVDLGFIQKRNPNEEFNWREISETNLNAGETWALLGLLVQTGQVEVIYVDREIQRLLHKHAKDNKLLGPRTLAKWMEYPRSTGSGRSIMRHVPGHTDHLHVRFNCAPDQKRCKTRGR